MPGPRRRCWIYSMLVAILSLPQFACGPATPEPIDRTHLIGRWELQTNNETEWVHLKEDGTLSADVRGNGFLARTIPAEPGARLAGTWQLAGKVITFRIDGASAPLTYEIVSLTDREMITVDGDGARRVLHKGI